MKKHSILAFVLIFSLLLTSCVRLPAVGKTNTYQVSQAIHSLKIRISAAEFTIEEADEFSVKSNLKYLSVSDQGGTLEILEETKNPVTYNDAMLTLYIPADMVFEEVSIITGAAKMSAGSISAKSLRLELGAGDVNIKCLNASSIAHIEGGAGQITIGSGMLNDLELEMGVGELNLTAALRGESDLALGVGESNITLIGSEDDYAVEIEKGIGSITVDGKDVSHYSGGNGQNCVEIEGGVGAINLEFQDKTLSFL